MVSSPELRQPIVALSLASLRKRIEIALLSDDVSSCSSTASPSANGTGAGRSWYGEAAAYAAVGLISWPHARFAWARSTTSAGNRSL